MVFLASNPNCNSSSDLTNGFLRENESITLECSVEFKGKWKPSMVWYKQMKNGSLKNANFRVTNDSSATHDRVTSSLKLLVDSSMHALIFVCVTRFDVTPSAGGEFEDIHAPEYVNRWRSLSLNVSCKYVGLCMIDVKKSKLH